MRPNDADGMANSADPDQTAPVGAVWSGSALFAQTYLSENLGSLRYWYFCKIALYLILIKMFGTDYLQIWLLVLYENHYFMTNGLIWNILCIQFTY